MNIFKKFIGRLLFPRILKFTTDLQDAFVKAVGETENFNTLIKSLSQTWLTVCPHTYFTELFLERKNWNSPFVRAFECSNKVDAKVCFYITQAYYLRHLLRIIKQDDKYRHYSQETIADNIRLHMSSGTKILACAADFEKSISNMASAEYLSMCYVEKVLEIQYPDRSVLDPTLASIWMDSDSMFGLNVFTAESIKRAKYIDSQYWSS